MTKRIRDLEKDWKDLIVRSELSKLKEFNDLAKELSDESTFKIVRSNLVFEKTEANSWIYKTLAEKKKLKLFDKCYRLILVGAGMFPYSMIDIQRKYPHLKQIGLEIIKERAAIANELIKYGPLKDDIKILNCDGILFDYSKLGFDDLIFVSCDVDSTAIIKEIMQKSKAHIFICAPYEKKWLESEIGKLNIKIPGDGSPLSYLE